jgi:murein DD-endopeptidase MepM/ murein hydrolase activator NlpD
LDEARLKEFNPVLAGEVPAGTTIIIPGGSSRGQTVSAPNLPNLRNYFKKPAAGFNWAKLHKNNAVDIANSCGTEVIASAEGLVIAAETEGWNGGYGAYVEMEHPNGTKTKYAHLAKVLVSAGDYLDQSQLLGTMGRTGEATGCHLHFEVSGARNPFAS